MNIVETYDYCDEEGNLLMQVCRLEPKSFRQRCPDGNGGWINSVKDVRKVPYHLDEIAEADLKRRVHIVEGEKDVDRLREEGLLATCNACGAEKWTEEHSKCLAGRHVAINPDNDMAGRRHAQKVAESLHGVAKSIKILELPGLPEKGDVSDWLNNGGTKKKLNSIRRKTELWTPPVKKQEKSTETADGDIVDGERNNTLFTMASKLRGADLSEESVVRSILAENEARCKPPLSESEVRSIVQSAFQDKGGGSGGKKSKADVLLDIVKGSCEFWKARDGSGYATVNIDGHWEHLKIRSEQFRNYLGKAYYDAIGRAVPAVAIVDVVNTLEGFAKYDGDCHDVHLRLAGHDGRIYLDMCDQARRVIEVDKKIWRIISEPPIRFHRPEPALPLPDPVRGGSVDALRPFLNITDEQWPLAVGWLFMTLCPWGAYPIMKLAGEQGTGKTKFAEAMRLPVDPNEALTYSAPKSRRDMFIKTQHNFVIAYDNLSFINAELSDAFCCISTGSAFSTRQLYSDDAEKVLQAKRPIITTGIEDVGLRSDFVDRSVLIELQRFGKGKRWSETDYDLKLEIARPKILGGLLDAAVVALRNIDRVRRKKRDLPRMADFAQWVIAGEVALGLKPGQFMKAYRANRKTASMAVLESTPVSAALFKMLRKSGNFEGNATELYKAMESWRYERQKGWPKAPPTLGKILTRLAPGLRMAGIEIDQVSIGRGNARRDGWKIAATDAFDSGQKSEPEPSDDEPPKPVVFKKDARKKKSLIEVCRTGKGVNK